jgi:hypothetical protein
MHGAGQHALAGAQQGAAATFAVLVAGAAGGAGVAGFAGAVAGGWVFFIEALRTNRPASARPAPASKIIARLAIAHPKCV